MLVGIVSTVAFDLSLNGVVPLESLRELLRHPEKYRHEVTATRHTGDTGAWFCHDEVAPVGSGDDLNHVRADGAELRS